MSLHGKGQQLRDDITNKLLKEKNPDEFRTKWGQDINDLIFDNFIYPLLTAKNEAAQKHLVGKLDLFCAAFVNPIE